jgi:DNA invertase Pin-like site-specific DNA recombinase
MIMPRLIGYARVSTEDQRPELQLDALRAAGCDPIFVEHRSGADRKRPELASMLAAVAKDDTVVVWRLDRLGRSLPHLIELVEQLGKADVGFKSLTEAIDTTTAGGRLIFHMMGALAEFERSLIRERTKAGMLAARGMGDLGKPSRSGLRLAGRSGRAPSIPVAIREAIVARLEIGELAKTIAADYGVGRSSVYRIAKAG